MYPEQRFRHRQDGTCHTGAHPNWGPLHLGTSKYTMADSGCLVSDNAYGASRFLGRDVTPGELHAYLQANDGFTPEGLMRWDVFSAFMRGLLVLSNRWDKTYTERAVIIAGRSVHWLFDLRGGHALDPISGNILAPEDLKARFVSGKWQDTNLRRYIKAMRKPAT